MAMKSTPASRHFSTSFKTSFGSTAPVIEQPSAIEIAALTSGLCSLVNAAISMALGCSITGAVDPKEVLKLVDKCLEAGVDFVAVADTVGYAGPKQVGELTKAIVKMSGAKPVCDPHAPGIVQVN